MKVSAVRIHLDDGRSIAIDYNQKLISFSDPLLHLTWDMVRKLKVLEDLFGEETK